MVEQALNVAAAPTSLPDTRSPSIFLSLRPAIRYSLGRLDAVLRPALGLQFGDATSRAEQGERDGLGSQLVEPAGGGLVADAALQGRHEVVERVGMRGRAAHVQCIRACALPAQGLRGKNLRKSCRRVNCSPHATIEPGVTASPHPEVSGWPQPHLPGAVLLGSLGQPSWSSGTPSPSESTWLVQSGSATVPVSVRAAKPS